MHKKKLILIGILFVFCLIGQWMVRGDESSQPVLNQSQTAAEENEKSAADETSPQEEKWNLPAGDLHTDLTRQILIMLVFVCLVGVGIWWFARRYGRGLAGGKGRQIRIVETIPLGPRKTVHVLEAGKRRLLLGSTPESISFLADVTDAIEFPYDLEGPQSAGV